MGAVSGGVSQRTAHRVRGGHLAGIGCVAFAAGTALVAIRVGAHPSYASDFLPGWLIVGVGVGFALPTIISAATADLPPARSATGSAVVTMVRQIGLALGVALFFAVVGTPQGFSAVHTAFRGAWWASAGASLLGAVTALGMTPTPTPPVGLQTAVPTPRVGTDALVEATRTISTERPQFGPDQIAQAICVGLCLALAAILLVLAGV